MKRMKYGRTPLIFLALLLASTSVVMAGDLVVGAKGAILKLHSGTYSELFAGESEASDTASVMALDVRADGELTRLLVPGTGSESGEHSYSLIYEDESGLAYLLWVGRYNGIHPMIYLTTYDGQSWGELMEITGSPFSDKGDPRLVITRDHGVEGNQNVQRTMMHIMWWELIGQRFEKRYSPLILQDGEFVGRNPVRNLDGFASLAIGDDFPPAALDSVLRVQPGSQSNSVLAGFVRSDTNRLVVLDFSVVHQALSRLAHEIGQELLASSGELKPDQLGTWIRRQILEKGSGFHPANLEFLADQIESLLSAGILDPNGDFEILVEDLGGMIIELGSRWGSDGLETIEAAEILQISPLEEADHPHHVKVTTLAHWPAPRLGVTAKLYLSRSGENAMLAWHGDNEIFYLETLGEDWAEVQSIPLSEDLDAATVHAILQQRTADR